MAMSEATARKIQELQLIEQNLQEILMHKQNIQVEINEAINALEELKTSGEEVYKILSGMMIRSEKKKIVSELEEKKKILELRANSFENQEKKLNEKVEELRKEITSSVGNNQ